MNIQDQNNDNGSINDHENSNSMSSESWTHFTKPPNAQLQQELTPLQYEVTQENGTEPAFNNAYWDNHAEGIYVDVVSGQPLFSSTQKFDSGTGWPSFTQPIDKTAIVEREDNSLLQKRTEVRSSIADSHLGHVFKDGPVQSGSMRYCTDSAALRFVPKVDMEKEGYGAYLYLFESNAQNL